MANRGLLAIYHPDGTGIRTFDTAWKLAVGWFILFDPPDDDFEVPLDGRSVTKIVLAMQSDGARVQENWDQLKLLEGRDPFLDKLIAGCQPLIEEVEKSGEDIVYSADIAELIDIGDPSILSLIDGWETIHDALDASDDVQLKQILVEFIGQEWLDDRKATEEEIDKIANSITPIEKNTPWSIIMSGGNNEAFIIPPIAFGWGTGVLKPDEIKENMFEHLDEEQKKRDELEQDENRWKQQEWQRIQKDLPKRKSHFTVEGRQLIIGYSLIVLSMFIFVIILWSVQDATISSNEYAHELKDAEDGDSWVVEGRIKSVEREGSPERYNYTFFSDDTAYFHSHVPQGFEDEKISLQIEYQDGVPWRVDEDIDAIYYLRAMCNPVLLVIFIGLFQIYVNYHWLRK